MSNTISQIPQGSIVLALREEYKEYTSEVTAMVSALITSSVMTCTTIESKASTIFFEMLVENRVNGLDFGIYNGSVFLVVSKKLINMIKSNRFAAGKNKEQPKIKKETAKEMKRIFAKKLNGRKVEEIKYNLVLYAVPDSNQFGDATIHDYQEVTVEADKSIMDSALDTLAEIGKVATSAMGAMFSASDNDDSTTSNDNSGVRTGQEFDLMGFDSIKRAAQLRLSYNHNAESDDSDEEEAIIAEAIALDMRINNYLLSK